MAKQTDLVTAKEKRATVVSLINKARTSVARLRHDAIETAMTRGEIQGALDAIDYTLLAAATMRMGEEL